MAKRLFDILLSLFLLVVLAVPCLIIHLVVVFDSRGGGLYWSDRIGKNNKIFKMPKFRTMRIDTPELATHLLEGADSYLTPIGKFLRKSSLDELPQLYSIFVGDMSFVGPRPALHNQEDLVKMRTDTGVHTLTPGLTGWAQVNGRDNISLIEKVRLDKEYLIKKNLFFDIRIMILTLCKIVKPIGISH